MRNINLPRRKTAIYLDISASMNVPLAEGSRISTMKATACLVAMLQKACPGSEIFTFSNNVSSFLSPTKGFKVIDELCCHQHNGGTNLPEVVRHANRLATGPEPVERVIILTDECSTYGQLPDAVGIRFPFIFNVGNTGGQNRVQVGSWIRTFGFSSQTIGFVAEHEKIMEARQRNRS